MIKNFAMKSLETGYRILEQLRFRRFDNFPFGDSPRGPTDTYERLFEAAQKLDPQSVSDLENEFGFQIDKEFLDGLAFLTQISIKESEPNYVHGRMLYAALREYISRSQVDYISIFETGTARGFSALCMARALEDAKLDGFLVSCDILPHDKPILWNCAADHLGPASRRSLLHNYERLLRRVCFIQADTMIGLNRVGLERINFAFIDAQHELEPVMIESRFVAERQQPGDVIVYDDVNRSMFPGVVEGVEAMTSEYNYQARIIPGIDDRGYAILTKE